MNLPTMEKDTEDYYQQFFENELSQPLVKTNPTELIAESQESGFIKKFGKRIVSNLLILIGGWLAFSSISMFFYMAMAHPQVSGLKMLLSLFIGLPLLFLGVGKVKKNSDWLLYAIFPLMGFISSFFLIFPPFNLWHDGNFFAVLFFAFLIALIIFYYIKDLKHPNN